MGCSQFSGGGAGTFWPALPQPEVDAIIKAALDGGISWFDTAEGYGAGRSERSLAAGLSRAGKTPGDVTVSTKWTPLGRTARSIERTIGDRTTNLAPFPVDLHQIHTGYGSLSSIRAQMRAMAHLVDAGQIRSVGVSNFSARQMKIAHKELAKHGIPLAGNQVQINLLHRKIETNGVLETARELGITLIAYVPLRSGMLTGKLHANPSLVATLPRMRRTMTGISAESLDRTAPLIDELRKIADAHQATIGQIALAWLITYYGDTVVATPGASKPHHAEEAAKAMQITLSDEDTGRLADLSTTVIR
ncbi:aldo/keto reductase [Nonomuraea angiospora]|uniref:aldo/keto reductase n=1 Tax=Nonomuraea angiospora TaxID=46172 RepID=UPI0029B2C8A7|nr:aldo/keto reductase [Nonomuraea angiospora]MDX3102737.1 aldo/keto reductase [Nonomuraea angiospora]